MRGLCNTIQIKNMQKTLPSLSIRSILSKKKCNFALVGMIMNDKKVEQLIATLEKYKKQLAKDQRKSKAFLKDAGILTPKGRFTKNYKHLCTQPGQVLF